uniref:TGB2 n=1 Tax=Yucca alphaflexivirus 1 TaxID=2794423 RepID=A0A7T5QZ95_9VIRU|nr:TGB2 [Yucca alphaflexivirus 1]
MPLVEPKSHHDTFAALAVGLAIVGFAWVITRSTLPHVGDNIHSLPHGGQYRDGTKQISYCSPRSHPGHSAKPSSHGALFLLLTLPLIIFLFERRHPAPRVHHCPLHPSEPAITPLPNNPHGGVDQYSQL